MSLLRLDSVESKRSFLGGVATTILQYFLNNMRLEAVVLSVMVIVLILDTMWGVYGAFQNKEFNGRRLIRGVLEKLVMYVTLITIAHLSTVMAKQIDAPVVSFLAPFIFGTMFAYEIQSVIRNIAKTRKSLGGLMRRLLKYFDDFDNQGNPKPKEYENR